MDNHEKYDEDLLRQYIESERIEKAPRDFTSKVMMRIQSEVIPAKVASGLKMPYRVPVLSVLVTIVLVAAVIFIPEEKTGSLALPVLNIIKNLTLSLPQIDSTSIFKINLPGILIYVFFGILMLTVFDKALSLHFHKEK
jgi:hypothetical protein